ncbi:MAG: low molecular weight phosphotyrosine protein phosphatase [Saprospiraceae bacterium]|nr:low molecular weight phosphotyrosine protein phosphatase [Saprospiraceae bacterium]
MKILMVCLGNICRSPLAEGILKHKVTQQGLNWEIDSAGTGAYHEGNLPDNRSIAVARKHGIDITDQRARQLKLSDFEDFDKIFVMDASNYRNVVSLAKTEQHKAKVEMIRNLVHPGMNEQVPDPYWGNDGFEAVYQMLDEACSVLIRN